MMELNELQEQITNIFLSNLKRDKIALSDDYLMMKITEELGELMQSYIVHKKRCRPEKYLSAEESKRAFTKELADVTGLVFAIASVMDVDLEEALVKKWITREWVVRKT
ncbi:MAG: hypothetical protein V1725_02625 [archaeon]